MGVGALTLEDRGASVQGVVDEIADGIRLVTDDREIFTEVDVLNDAVDNEGFRHQAGEREKTGRGVKDETGGHGDEKVHHEKGGTDVEAGIFLQDHGQNIRTAAGSADVKEDGCAQGRQEDREDQLQHRLGGQGMGHRQDLFHAAQGHGHQHADIDGLDAEGFSEKKEAQHQESHIQEKGPVSGADGGQLRQKDGHTGDPSEGKVVWKLENIDTDYHDQCRHGNNPVLTDGTPHFWMLLEHNSYPLFFCFCTHCVLL